MLQALLSETEKLLETWKHPDPYCPPTAPGGMSHIEGKTRRMEFGMLTVQLGSKYERNLPVHTTDRKLYTCSVGLCLNYADIPHSSAAT